MISQNTKNNQRKTWKGEKANLRFQNHRMVYINILLYLMCGQSISMRIFDIFIYATVLCLLNAFYMAVMEEAGKTLSWHLATEPPITIKATREMLQDTTNRWGQFICI